MADTDKDVDGKGDDGKDVDGKGDVGKDVDGRGGANGSADLIGDIVSRATALGGWLVVSFVAPLPPSGVNTAPRADATAVFRKGFTDKADAAVLSRKTADTRARKTSRPKK
jgi:hypothetical protein